MAEPGLEPTPLDAHPLPRLKGALIVEVPCAGLGILPRATVLAPLGILRGLAVWAGVLDLGHTFHGSCWTKIQPVWVEPEWRVASPRVCIFCLTEGELEEPVYPTPPPLWL